MKRSPNVQPPRPFEQNWRPFAACRSVDPELFFPVSSTGASLQQTADAKAICAGCPVRRQCLSFALGTRQTHGIWGGMTEEERYRKTPRRQADSPMLKPPAIA